MTKMKYGFSIDRKDNKILNYNFNWNRPLSPLPLKLFNISIKLGLSKNYHLYVSDNFFLNTSHYNCYGIFCEITISLLNIAVYFTPIVIKIKEKNRH